MSMETIKFSELKRLAFCNSSKIYNKKFIIGDRVEEWVGIGFVETRDNPDPKKHITVVEG